MKLFKPRVNSNISKHFFKLRIIDQWNNLPEKVGLANATSSFKHSLDKFWSETGYGHNQRPLAY